MFYPRLSPPVFISLPASVVTVCDIGQMSPLQISHRKIRAADKIQMDQNRGTSKWDLMATFPQRFKPLLKNENEGVRHWSTAQSLWWADRVAFSVQQLISRWSGVRTTASFRAFLHNCPDWRCGQLTFCLNGCRGTLPGVKRSGRDANHTLTTEVKNEESYTSAPSIMPSWSGQRQIYLLPLRALHGHSLK
jgi:hypothetical protein